MLSNQKLSADVMTIIAAAIQSDLLDLPRLYAMFIGLSRFSFRAQILARPFVAPSMIDADE